MVSRSWRLSVQHRTQALAVAEAGLDSAVWRLKEDATFAPSVGETVTVAVAVDSGEALVTLHALDSYRLGITSAGHTTAKPDVVRFITTEIFNMSLWNFILGADTYSVQSGGGGATHGHTSVWGPFYVKGDLDMTGSSSMQIGPLFVRDGDITLDGSTDVGTVADPVMCYVSGVVQGHTSNFHGTINSNVPELTLPTFGAAELTQAYNLALVESGDDKIGTTDVANNETRLGYDYKVFDADTAVGGATTTVVIDDDTASFPDGSVWDDDFAYDAVTGILYVQGTVFIDGDLRFERDLIYEGRGTIICTGDIYFGGTFNPADEDSYPVDNVIGFATPNNIDMADGGDATSSFDMTGAWYAGGRIDIVQNATIRGSILANLMYFGGANINLLTDPDLPANLPPSLPGADDGSTVFMTRWHDAGS